MTVSNASDLPGDSHAVISTPRLDRFRRNIIILAIVSFLSYPLLCGVAWLVDLMMGRTTRTTTSGFMTHNPISDPGMYTFMIGLTAAVGLWFVYLGLRTWADPLKRSASRLFTLGIIGVIVTSISMTAISILLVLVSALLNGVF